MWVLIVCFTHSRRLKLHYLLTLKPCGLHQVSSAGKENRQYSSHVGAVEWHKLVLSHCNFKTTLCCWYNSNISASCKCTLWKSYKLLILLVIIKRRQLTVSPLSPLIWGSSARSDSARAAVFARLSHRGRNPSDLGLGSCDSWTGLQTVQTGWNLKK